MRKVHPDTPAFDGAAGLTKREYMATAILAGMQAHGFPASATRDEVATHALHTADALIRALNEGEVTNVSSTD